MQNLAKLPSKAWVPLLWSQYNKLSEPLKEGFSNLAYSVAKEAGILTESNNLIQKAFDTQKRQGDGGHISDC